MSNQISAEVAEWMAKVAKAIEEVGDLETTYGRYNIGKAPVLFDGREETGYRLIPNEFGGHDLEVA